MIISILTEDRLKDKFVVSKDEMHMKRLKFLITSRFRVMKNKCSCK